VEDDPFVGGGTDGFELVEALLDTTTDSGLAQKPGEYEQVEKEQRKSACSRRL
jgi:hypothetical protein